MTILTKTSNEKKYIFQLPLGVVANGDEAQLNIPPSLQTALLKNEDAKSMLLNKQHVSITKTFLLFLASLLVMVMGIFGGYGLYRMYAPCGRFLFRGICDIPYTSHSNFTTVSRLYGSNQKRSLLPKINSSVFDNDFFREEVNLDMTDQSSYTKIDIPNLKDGRRVRFMHDFKDFQSAIIDTTYNRCFIMPLDKETTLPPKSFLDLMIKMQSGYYNIDADRLRKRMRVKTPESTVSSLTSQNIAEECKNKRVYMLESYVSGVFKREVRLKQDLLSLLTKELRKLIY